jgi:hypothetical protein
MLIGCTKVKPDEFCRQLSAAYPQALRNSAVGQDGCIRDTYVHSVLHHVTPVVSLVRFCNYVLIKINFSSENTGYHYT